ncbi:hybrid sensor histidine kinase/response regulator [Leptolyngbya sp. FACHB-261]|uniref:hybrid sensor histidine kinase/response regulator n=1 Tax=Leptolyngbya sp. FACHB-261 TaxID=2692806 RepID=UPI001685118D|nr:hybrid sensor histidine kinase/response regulator [Leptolyngbya sp. FACHB-261]MBD2104176.1 hybrid sensor histidine kinase/response regulator [Leptolyngbya sp. FACHB-261]
MSNVADDKSIILIVDDNSTNLGVLFDFLSDSGFKILVAQDGESAIEQISYVKPDIILLDVIMPGIDGFETCRRLKASDSTRDIPIIFMTALSQTMDKVKGFEVGAVDYVTKPIEHEEVLARINTHITIENLKQCLQANNDSLQQEINERKRIEEALRVLLHAVSHDLRNPVTGTLMVLKNLLKRGAKAEANPLDQDLIPVRRSVLERMIQGSERQLHLINSLLEAHANDVQGVVLHCTQVQLSSLLQTLVADLEPLLVQNQATLINSTPDDLPPIEADPTQLWRVFENLITNALKHNPPGLQIKLNASLEDNCIRCTIEDSGIGLDPQQCQTLFDLYVRGSQARRSLGLGLGLYLCRQIVTAHGGQVGAISRPGAGATFWLTLPLAASVECQG